MAFDRSNIPGAPIGSKSTAAAAASAAPPSAPADNNADDRSSGRNSGRSGGRREDHIQLLDAMRQIRSGEYSVNGMSDDSVVPLAVKFNELYAQQPKQAAAKFVQEACQHGGLHPSCRR